MDSDDSSQQKSPPRSRQAGLKPRKMRVSCDACSRSKIKCNQTRPVCGRCEKLGLTCHYSPSRRMGKPPASSRDLGKSGLSSKASRENKSFSDLEEDFNSSTLQSHSSSINSTPHPQYSTISSDSTFQFDPSLLFPDTSLPMTNMADWSNFDMSGINTPNFNDFDQCFSLMDPSMETSGIKRFIQREPICDIADFDEDFTTSIAPSVPQNNCFAGLNFSMFQEPMTTPSYNMTPPVTPGFNCTTLASSTLQSLNLDSNSCSSFSMVAQSGKSLEALDGSCSGSSVDQMLIINKTAIKNVSTLITCPCSHSQQSSITIALIIDKILAQYQAIARKPTSKSSSAASSLSSSPESFRIAIGAYRMDAEDEQRIRMQFVSNELRKAVALVKKFSDRYAPQRTRGGDEIYITLAAFLNRRVKEAAEEIRALWSRL